jgi:hypothetical protein
VADLKFQDFGLDPDEAVKTRQKALDEYTNIAQPALKSQQQKQRGQLASDVYAQAAGAASQGAPGTLMQEALGKAAQGSAELLPKQAEERDAANLQGAEMQQDVMNTRQQTAIAKYVKDTEEAKAETARFIANRAFEMGIGAGQLSLHNNAYLADYGIRQMYEDYQSGRVTKQEIQKFADATQLEAQRQMDAIQNEEATLKGQLAVAVGQANEAAARELSGKLFKMYKDAAEAKARAAQIGGIISGVFTIGGAVAGGLLTAGNPAGIAAGMQGGQQLGSVTNALVNK